MTATKQTSSPQPVIAYKGLNNDWTCRGFKFEVGKTYKHTGDVVLCKSGFHACENPIDVLGYYSPTGKITEVELSGEMSCEKGDDSKIAAGTITIRSELSIHEYAARVVDYAMSRVDIKNTRATNTGDWSVATNTGDWSVATNTGYQSVAPNTGYQSMATNTGDWSVATNTGDWSVATNTGHQSVATNTGHQSMATNTGDWSVATNTGDGSVAAVEGKDSVAVATGYQSRVAAGDGSALFLVECDDDHKIIAVWAGIAGRDGIKPGVLYMLKDGQPVEAGQ